ncbi:MAG: NAD(P)-dependent oxidoreductase [Chloroflexi bacterium]|nr:NAD(P)-dependent oxidoreductase [Chloroflexota bacterium]
MTVLVLGAGYIGAALIASHLQSGDRVVAMDNGFATDWDAIGRLMDGNCATLVRGDIREAGSIASVISHAWPVRVVYLLAAQASANPDAATPEYTEETNLRGPRLVLEAVRDAARAAGSPPPPVVYGSSFHLYGPGLHGDVDETCPVGAQADLSHLSKVYAERLGEMHANRDGMTVVPVRLGIVYGVGPVTKRDLRFVTVPHAFALRRLGGLPVTINPSGVRPLAFCHLEDAVAALRLAPVGLAPGTFAPANAATEVLTVPEVLYRVDASAREFGIAVPDAGSREPRTSVVRFRIRSRLAAAGWLPRHDVAGSMPEILRHYAGQPVRTPRSDEADDLRRDT